MSRTYKTYPQKDKYYMCFSVPKWFKRLNRQDERSKQNQALRCGKEVPIFRTRDAYEYW
jgi:hypothetical protein